MHFKSLMFIGTLQRNPSASKTGSLSLIKSYSLERMFAMSISMLLDVMASEHPSWYMYPYGFLSPLVKGQECQRMIGYSFSAILDGMDASIVHVEADVSPGIPQFSIVGLPDSSVREAKLRVRSAIKNSNFDFPNQRITVNLSPASIRKRGAGLDLAIAVAILRASRQIPSDIGARMAFCAELGLDGLLVPAEAMVNLSLGLREGGIRHIVASSRMTWNLPIPDVEWYVFNSLRDVVNALLHPEFERMCLMASYPVVRNRYRWWMSKATKK
jgi:hypothetical protein